MSNLPFKHSVSINKNTPSGEPTDEAFTTAGTNDRIEADKFGNPLTIRVSNVKKNGNAVITNQYPSINYQSIPIFELSIRPVNNTTFRFIVSVKKNNEDPNPVLYTSKKYYDELIASYNENNPYLVLDAIKASAIVCINYQDYIDKVGELKVKEFNVAKAGVVTDNHVFVESKHSLNNGSLPPNFDYELSVNYENLVRYIDYSVRKKNTNLEDRILSVNEIGNWNDIVDVKIETMIVNTKNTKNDYAPVGRRGQYEGEIVKLNDVYFEWREQSGGVWLQLDDNFNIN